MVSWWGDTEKIKLPSTPLLLYNSNIQALNRLYSYMYPSPGKLAGRKAPVQNIPTSPPRKIKKKTIANSFLALYAIFKWGFMPRRLADSITIPSYSYNPSFLFSLHRFFCFSRWSSWIVILWCVEGGVVYGKNSQISFRRQAVCTKK